jgi:hypothetical protein
MDVLRERIESPSLGTTADGAGPAFELKFLLPEGLAQAVDAHVRGRLPLDPHGDPALGGAYQTTTLYLDTPALDVLNRTPGFRRRKYRVRRYGASADVFLERKTRQSDRVCKRRAVVPGEELGLLADPTAAPGWSGEWFHRSLLVRGLRPTCLVGYQRTAYMGASAEGPLRLTLDRGVRGLPVHDWEVGPCRDGLPLPAGQVIVEFKFRAALPVLFKELVREFRLQPGGVSKYRLCMQAWHVAGAIEEAIGA